MVEPGWSGRLGVCGLFLSLLQCVVLERDAVAQVDMTWGAAGAWLAFTVALVAAYALTSWFLVEADAGLFNLSLLTSDVYAVLFSLIAVHRLVSWLYFLAFGLTMSGLIVYHRAPSATSAFAVTSGASSQPRAGPEGWEGPGHERHERYDVRRQEHVQHGNT